MAIARRREQQDKRVKTVVCQATDEVGDCVKVSGQSVHVEGYAEPLPRVERLDITTVTAIKPAVGVVVAKASPTICTIVTRGEIEYPGLTPGRVHWVSAAGRLAADLPTPRTGEKIICQAMGVALDENKFLVSPEITPTIRAS
jgi:hypothetical protein